MRWNGRRIGRGQTCRTVSLAEDWALASGALPIEPRIGGRRDEPSLHYHRAPPRLHLEARSIPRPSGPVNSRRAQAAIIENISNGGFESGLTGWSCTVTGQFGCNITNDAHTGNFAFQGFENTDFGTLAQTIATTPGTTYNFSVFSRNESNNVANVLRYSLDGGVTTAILRTAVYSLTTDSFVTSGTSAAIRFFFETNRGTGSWHIDNVSVSAVPLPAALPLLASALVGFGLVGYRKRKAQAA